MFTSITAKWNAESKFKIKGLQKCVSKEVPLYHSKFIYRLGTHTKFNSEKEKVIKRQQKY